MSLTINEQELIKAKVEEVIRACISVRYFDYNHVISKLEKMKASPSKIFACLYYIYSEHDGESKTKWDIDDHGLVYQLEHEAGYVQAWHLEWYEVARCTFDFFLDPAPLFCRLSGCYKIIETGEVIRVIQPEIITPTEETYLTEAFQRGWDGLTWSSFSKAT